MRDFHFGTLTRRGFVFFENFVFLLARLEKRHRDLKLLRLRRQFFGGGGNVFRDGGILLNHLIQLLNRRVNLAGAVFLLAGRRADFLNQFGGALNIRHKLFQHLSGMFGNRRRRIG